MRGLIISCLFVMIFGCSQKKSPNVTVESMSFDAIVLQVDEDERWLITRYFKKGSNICWLFVVSPAGIAVNAQETSERPNSIMINGIWIDMDSNITVAKAIADRPLQISHCSDVSNAIFKRSTKVSEDSLISLRQILDDRVGTEL